MRLTRIHTEGRHEVSRAKRVLPRLVGWIVVVALLLVVFWLDRVTAAAPVQHLYYLPIILASLQIGRGAGLGVSVAAVVSYHLANPMLLTTGYRESDIVQIALFVAVALVTARLSDDARRLHQLAMTDDLTGLHNLRSFETHLTQMVNAARETRTTLSMLALDVDRLKSINDTYGHLAGAEAVRMVGHVLAANLPRDAVACRYGGDEFVVALPRCTSEEAHAIADHLRGAVNTVAPVLAGVEFPAATLSISLGLACLTHDHHGLTGSAGDDVATGEALFKAADQALYLAKGSGRNRVSVSRTLPLSARASTRFSGPSH